TREAAELARSSEHPRSSPRGAPTVAGAASGGTMNRTFERVRSEPSPDLWPEIARRLDEPPRPGTSRRGRQALSVIVSVALVAGGLVWALSALRLESRPSGRSLAPRAAVRMPSRQPAH